VKQDPDTVQFTLCVDDGSSVTLILRMTICWTRLLHVYVTLFSMAF